jgi:FkbM family methyltransferase
MAAPIVDPAPATPAAHCLGVDVPASPFLNETRIDRINSARYEGDEIAASLALIREGDRVLELGAGIGLVGGVIARNRAVERIISFEANPDLIPVARALYALNGLQTIELRNQLVLSGPDQPASLPFHIHGSYLGSSLLLGADRAKRTVEIPTADWAGIVADLRPTVLVMDIEGGELALLEHADLSGLRAVILELHPKAYGEDGTAACRKRLRQSGLVRVPSLCRRDVFAFARPEQAAEFS